MSDQRTLAAYHAVLVGIDAYHEKPLTSCVRDVEDFKAYLEHDYLGWMSEAPNIYSLTAPSTKEIDLPDRSTTSSKSSNLSKDRRSWPTYDNVKATFLGVLSQAQAGDFVYIHFSGHGTTIPPSQGFSNSATGELALVLLRGLTGISLLKGSELASLIKDMVNKGLTVTLVLDCCFAGSTMRDDGSTRFVMFDPKFHAAPETGARTTPGVERGTEKSSHREASMLPNWLINPDGYSILTACGPTESAGSIVDENRLSHGALSYLLLRALKRLDHGYATQQLIYQHLRIKFLETESVRRLVQNPILYGNSTLSFFGPANLGTSSALVPIIQSGDGLRLEAGEAHGVSNGDTFVVTALRPAKKEAGSRRDPTVVKVSRGGSLTSDLALVGTSINQTGHGLLATPLARFSLRRFPIELGSAVSFSEERKQSLQRRSTLNIYEAGDFNLENPVAFYLTTIGDHSYELRDELNRSVPNIPALTDNSEKEWECMLDVLEHLVMFKMIRQLANNSLMNVPHPFDDLYTAKLVNSTGTEINPGCSVQCSHPKCLIKVKSDSKLTLVINNNTKTNGNNLYLHVFNMSSDWKVENVLRGTYEVIPPRYSNKHQGYVKGTTGEYREDLYMQITEEMKEKGTSCCEDIIKVFLTTRPTSFASLELPAIFKFAGLKGVDSTREGGNIDLPEDWAALNFRVQTSFN
ncbi:MAG: hypothetical protein M1814_005792 [Vezdaea aestivalis]|nr:MAG: hypothetical protein M1814_005792 [Vezdaea aestivalis]